jgi:hypothetical protein
MTYNQLPSHIRGDTWTGFDLTLTEGPDNTPVDLTGTTVAMQMRTSANATTAAESWTTADDSIVFLDAANGQIRITEKVVGITPGDYVLDVQVTFTDGKIQTVFRGKITIEADVTR